MKSGRLPIYCLAVGLCRSISVFTVDQPEPTEELRVGASCNDPAAEVMQESKETALQLVNEVPNHSSLSLRARASLIALFNSRHDDQHFGGGMGPTGQQRHRDQLLLHVRTTGQQLINSAGILRFAR